MLEKNGLFTGHISTLFIGSVSMKLMPDIKMLKNTFRVQT